MRSLRLSGSSVKAVFEVEAEAAPVTAVVVGKSAA